MKKENYRMRTAINIAQNLCDAASRYVYFTCKYYGTNWSGSYLESIKVSTMLCLNIFKTGAFFLVIHRL